MSKRKFDYMEFDEGYGVIFDAEVYSPSEAIEVFKEEFDYLCECDDPVNAPETDFEVYEVRVKWQPRMDRDDMFYNDVYDKEDIRGLYKIVEDEDIKCNTKNKGFKCWRVRYDEAVKN